MQIADFDRGGNRRKSPRTAQRSLQLVGLALQRAAFVSSHLLGCVLSVEIVGRESFSAVESIDELERIHCQENRPRVGVDIARFAALDQRMKNRWLIEMHQLDEI